MHPKAGKQGARPNPIVCFETLDAPEIKCDEAIIDRLDGVVNSYGSVKIRCVPIRRQRTAGSPSISVHSQVARPSG
jgi:hypothetical protein